MSGACECSNEPLGGIKCGIFLDYLVACWLLRNDSALWSQLVINMSAAA